MRAAEPVAPSDVVDGAVGHARRVSVGGRVVDVRRGRAVIGDAFAAIEIRFESGPPPIAPGDLVVVAGRVHGKRLEHGRLVERHPAPPIVGQGEFARLALHGVGNRLRARAVAFDTIRDHFRAAGFVEVDTPIRVRAVGLDLHVEPMAAEGGYLITSPELHMKRLLAGGMPRIYQIVHASRAGEQGALHEPEFAMLEWYRAFSGQAAVIADTEVVVESVVRRLTGGTRLKLPDGRSLDVRSPYAKTTIRDAFARYAGVSDAVELARRDPDRFFELLVDSVEPALAKLRRPVFVTDWPMPFASLARPSPRDPTVAERFELYAAGVELCNGFGELTDAAEQRRRFISDQRARRRLRRPVYPIDEKLIAALEEGMPPSGGNALGIDRLVMLALGARSIADVLSFPAARL